MASSSRSPSSSTQSASTGDPNIIKFQCFSSNAQVSFWQELAKLKIDVLGLDQKALDITGTYALAPATTVQGLPSRFSVAIESFNKPSQHASGGSLLRECRVSGVLKNMNTDEAFRTFDKNTWLQSLGSQIWEDILNGEAVKDPTRLLRFSILCFADIKRNAFIYWFAFPALVSNPPFRHLRPPTPLTGTGGCFSEAECLMLHAGFRAFRRLRMDQTNDPYCPPFFLVIRSMVTSPTSSGGSSSSLSLEVAPLETYEKLSDSVKQSSVAFGFVDPSTVPMAPGWPLRNLLILLANRWRLTKATVLCYRGKIERLEKGSTEDLSPTEALEAVGSSFVIHAALCPMVPANPSDGPAVPTPSSIGWELNKGKNMPRRMDLSSMMDPKRLAESSVDLNLKLMRWRLLPALDVELLAKTRCLLIGSGTLGCGVARCLLGWGVRTITLIDNGRVALSNPVRQSLFEYTDCLDGGKLKAPAAADALKRIFPGVISEGYVMTIPMPGHPLQSQTEVETAKREVAKLDELVRNHDVIYLLTDTRESRWLPTVMAVAHDKMLINAALGFDSFMIMRHGGAIRPGKEDDPNRIGCYFCNDVVAPDDSTKDRTLDQQCTVTRPGLAQAASALAVELMVSLLHHPLKHHAPADTTEEAVDLGRLDDPDRPLGILPQQIRVFLSHFTTILPVTRAFKHCTGCAKVMVSEYQTSGFDLVHKACNNNEKGVANYLEELTGLAQMRKEVEDVDMLWLDEDEEDEDDEREDEVILRSPEAQLSMSSLPSETADDGDDDENSAISKEQIAVEVATDS